MMSKLHTYPLTHAKANVLPILNEITGRQAATVVEHADGRRDVNVTPDTVRVSVDEVDGRWRDGGLNGFRRRLYDVARRSGLSHEEAVFRLFPEGRVTV